MKIAYASDTHIEIGPQTNELIVPADADVLVLAGDIGPGAKTIDWITETFGSTLPIIYVPGNHDVYDRVYQAEIALMRSRAAQTPNIHFLMNDSIQIGDLWFIGSMCWTDYNLDGNIPGNMARASGGIGDFNRIGWRDSDGLCRAIIPKDCLSENTMAKFFIFEELRKRGQENSIVITHHAPTELSIAPGFERSSLNSAYVNTWGNEIAYRGGPRIWFHGHVHDPCDYMVGATRVLSNPIGYPRQFTGRGIVAVDA